MKAQIAGTRPRAYLVSEKYDMGEWRTSTFEEKSANQTQYGNVEIITSKYTE